MTEAEFNRLAARAITASRWCSRPSPTSTPRCPSISSSPTSPIPTCSNRWSAASALAAIHSSGSPLPRASKCAGRTVLSCRESGDQSNHDGRSARVHRRLSRALQGCERCPACRGFAAGWSAISVTTRCAISRSGLPARTSPIRWARRISCCWLSEEIAIVDNLSGKLSLVVYAEPASPMPISRRAAGSVSC